MKLNDKKVKKESIWIPFVFKNWDEFFICQVLTLINFYIWITEITFSIFIIFKFEFKLQFPIFNILESNFTLHFSQKTELRFLFTD